MEDVNAYNVHEAVKEAVLIAQKSGRDQGMEALIKGIEGLAWDDRAICIGQYLFFARSIPPKK